MYIKWVKDQEFGSRALEHPCTFILPKPIRKLEPKKKRPYEGIEALYG